MNELGRILREEILPAVEAPAQYLALEKNVIVKPHAGVGFRFAFAFPDSYTVGMSHLGLQIIYHILNQRADSLCERVFAPWPDMEKALRARGLPLTTLESQTPLQDFDVVGFSLQYEMGYTNLLNMLDLGGIPLHREDRTEAHPLVMAGGPGAMQPEPLADFVDLFYLGDAEEGLQTFADTYQALKKSGASRRDLILGLVRKMPFLYAPALYKEVTDAQGRYLRLEPLHEGIPSLMRPTHVEDLDEAGLPERPLVPHLKSIHDRITLEIMRGCPWKCRFCSSTMIKRPVRYRSVSALARQAEAVYASTGYDEIGLTSLSSSDYPDLLDLVETLSGRFTPRGVGLSFPSLRVGEQMRILPKFAAQVRRSGLTLAPEVASDRLRNVVDKRIKNSDLVEGCRIAFQHGWELVKLYFMVGIPTETPADIDAIADLGFEISRTRRAVAKHPARVNLSCSIFVPKPHTAFQWAPMLPMDEVSRIRQHLRGRVGRSPVALKFHHVQRSYLEGAMARGDRRIGKVIEAAWRRGARFDAWDEHFNFGHWTEAFKETGVDPEAFTTRAYGVEEPLPWDHIAGAIRKEYLLRDKARYEALSVQETLATDAEAGESRAKDTPQRRAPLLEAVAAADNGDYFSPPAQMVEG